MEVTKGMMRRIDVIREREQQRHARLDAMGILYRIAVAELKCISELGTSELGYKIITGAYQYLASGTRVTGKSSVPDYTEEKTMTIDLTNEQLEAILQHYNANHPIKASITFLAAIKALRDTFGLTLVEAKTVAEIIRYIEKYKVTAKNPSTFIPGVANGGVNLATGNLIHKLVGEVLRVVE